MGFRPGNLVAIDTETTGLSVWHGDRPFSIGISNGELETWYCDFDVDPYTREVYTDPADLDYVQEILSDDKIKKVFHNAVFDISMLESVGLKVNYHTFGDTIIVTRVCSTMEFAYGLKPLTKKYFGYDDGDLGQLHQALLKARRYAKKWGWNIMPPKDKEADYWTVKQVFPNNDDCRIYCEHDVRRTILLWKFFHDNVMNSCEEYKRTYEWEMSLWEMVYRMHTRGVRIDPELAVKERDEMAAKGEIYLAECEKIAAENGVSGINFKSSKSVSELLYGPLGLEAKIVSKKTGRGSVSKGALRDYGSNAFVRSLSGYKACQKGVNDFFQKYLTMARPDRENPAIQVLHPGFNQVGTRTGRFSCSNPNLQQVPNADSAVEGFEKIQGRAPFGPRPGYIWYCADYSQMELRMFADISQEPQMLEAIRAGRDIMTEVANKAWGGKGNEAGIYTAAIALELNRPVADRAEVLEAWEKFGWDREKAEKIGLDDEGLEVAEKWLASFDYNITLAEASVGKKTTRGRAKMCTYAKTYGGGPKSVAGLLYVSLAQAKLFLKDLDSAFPHINEYMQEVMRQARRDGYIITKYGRKLNVIPDLAYKAVNYQVQGAAADLMKQALWKTDTLYQESAVDAFNVMTIHDELVAEIRKEHSSTKLLRGIKDLMEDTGEMFSVPMEVVIKKAEVRWDMKDKVEL